MKLLRGELNHQVVVRGLIFSRAIPSSFISQTTKILLSACIVFWSFNNTLFQAANHCRAVSARLFQRLAAFPRSPTQTLRNIKVLQQTWVEDRSFLTDLRQMHILRVVETAQIRNGTRVSGASWTWAGMYSSRWSSVAVGV